MALMAWAVLITVLALLGIAFQLFYDDPNHRDKGDD